MAERQRDCYCCDCNRFYDNFHRTEENLCDDGVNVKDAFGGCKETYAFNEGDWNIDPAEDVLECLTTDSPITFWTTPGIFHFNTYPIFPGTNTGSWWQYVWGPTIKVKFEWTAEDELKITAETNLETRTVTLNFIGAPTYFYNLWGEILRRADEQPIFKQYCEPPDYDLLEIFWNSGAFACLKARLDASTADDFAPYQLRASAGMKFGFLKLIETKSSCSLQAHKGCCELCDPDEQEQGRTIPTTIAVTFDGLQDGEIHCCTDVPGYLACRADCVEAKNACLDYYGGEGLFFPCLAGCGYFAPGCFEYCGHLFDVAVCNDCQSAWNMCYQGCFDSFFECTPNFCPVSQFNDTYLLDLDECPKCDGGGLPCTYVGSATVEDVWILVSEYACDYSGTTTFPISAELNVFYTDDEDNPIDVRINVYPPFNVVLRNEEGEIQFISTNQPMAYTPRLTTGRLDCADVCSGGEFDLYEDIDDDEGKKIYADEIVMGYFDPIRWAGAEWKSTFPAECSWVEDPETGGCICGETEKSCTPADHTEITPFRLAI